MESRVLWIASGTLLLVSGVTAYITGLNIVGAIILGIIGIIGIIAGIKGFPEKSDTSSH